MGFKLGKDSNNQGIFVSEITIENAEVEYDVKLTRKDGSTVLKKDGSPLIFDVSVTVYYNYTTREGDVRDSSISFNGIYKKDSAGNPTGWGSAWYSVGKLFAVSGAVEPEEEINDDGTIPKSWIRRLIGKSIKVITYRSISGYWAKDKTPYSSDLDDNIILDKFKDTYERKGYPRDYDPDSANVSNKEVSNETEDEYSQSYEEEEDETVYTEDGTEYQIPF